MAHRRIAGPAGAGAGGIAALDDEARHDSVKEGVVVDTLAGQDTRTTRSSSAPAPHRARSRTSRSSSPRRLAGPWSIAVGRESEPASAAARHLAAAGGQRHVDVSPPPRRIPQQDDASGAAIAVRPSSRRRSLLAAPAMIAACSEARFLIARYRYAWSARLQRRRGSAPCRCALRCAASSTAWRRAGMSAQRPGRQPTWRRWPPRCSTSGPSPSAPSTSAPGSATARC